MSPTLLELVVLVVLLIAAWQLGVLLAPVILRELRSMRESLDEVSEELLSDEEARQQTAAEKEKQNGSKS
jgi:hypothetical protein